MPTKIIQKQFKRIETKYILEKTVLKQLLQDLEVYMEADAYATSTITNIYFDTEQFDLIQDSIAKKYAREKVRMRLYDPQPQASSKAFLEIKKKIDGIGYKNRLTSTANATTSYVTTGLSIIDGLDQSLIDDQIQKDLTQLRQRHQQLQPKMYIYYDRLSFRGKQDADIRITIDQNLLYRDWDISLSAGKSGKDLLDPSKVIMEVKVPEACPTWLPQIFNKYGITQASFSKYGTAYRLASQENRKELSLARNTL